jgi:hypothetical protein
MEELAGVLEKLLREDFPAAYSENCSDKSSALIKIRNEERLVLSEISALRLLQSEDRMVNNLALSIFGGGLIANIAVHFLR